MQTSFHNMRSCISDILRLKEHVDGSLPLGPCLRHVWPDEHPYLSELLSFKIMVLIGFWPLSTGWCKLQPWISTSYPVCSPTTSHHCLCLYTYIYIYNIYIWPHGFVWKLGSSQSTSGYCNSFPVSVWIWAVSYSDISTDIAVPKIQMFQVKCLVV
jgi:hypothetical protein